MMEPGKRTLIVIRQAPYGGSLARAAVDAALAAGAFEQPVSVLLLGAGVLNLLPDQDGAALDRSTLAKIIDSMPLYGIETVHVDAEAAAAHGLEPAELPAYARCCSRDQIRALFADHDHLLGF